MRTVNIEDFARRVERMCDFILAKKGDETGRDGSPDLKVIEDLKEEAADLQFSIQPITETLDGLHEYMKGVPGESNPTDDRQEDRS